MKLHRTLPIKLFCFLLCLLSLLAIAACTAGGIALIEFDFYSQSKPALRDELLWHEVYSDACTLARGQHFSGYYAPGRYDADHTSLRYLITAPGGAVEATNLTDSPTADDPRFTYTFYYLLRHTENGEPFFDFLLEPPEDTAHTYTIRLFLAQDGAVSDDYTLIQALTELGYRLRYAIWGFLLAAILLAVGSFLVLLCLAGRTPRSEELSPGPLNRIPFDLLLAMMLLLFLGTLPILDDLAIDTGITVALMILWALAALCTLIGLCMSAAVRVKQKRFLRGTLIGMMISLIGRLLRAVWSGIRTVTRALPIVWRTALLCLASLLIDIVIVILALENSPLCLLVLAWKSVFFSFCALYTATLLHRLEKAGSALAAGDLSYKVDTAKLIWAFRRHGENLNRIGEGMSAAVEKRLQSERMKTELITGVSHDIKTPLTSILSYAGLIADPACDPEKSREYASVLVRKSEHLRRLLDDLIEASKASTGNVELMMVECDAGVLLTQASGEFESRCEQAELTLVVSQPEQSPHILADSRRIWRVLENLLSNACKYSLPGSRVYLTLEEKDGMAQITIRNTSREPLNLTPAELSERFVRGDASRSTEGSGLGLSIARSLTELMGGEMEIVVDGDLFKVGVRFPVV